MARRIVFRFGALISFSLSLASFVLYYVLTTSGTGWGLEHKFPIITVNTTNVAKGVVQIPGSSAANQTDAGSSMLGMVEGLLTSGASSLLGAGAAMLGSGGSTATSNGQVTANGTTALNTTASGAKTNSTEASAGTGFLSTVGSFFSSLFGRQVRETIGVLSSRQIAPEAPVISPKKELISTSERSIIGDAIGPTILSTIDQKVASAKTQVNLQQFYTFHVQGICYGNGIAPNFTVRVTACKKYSEAFQTIRDTAARLDPSTDVATVNITIPALKGEVAAFSPVLQVFATLLDYIAFPAYVVALIFSGLLSLLSLLMVFLASNKFLFFCSLGSSTIATPMALIGTVTTIIVMHIEVQSLGAFSEPVGVTMQRNTRLIPPMLIADGLLVVINIFWVAVWWARFVVVPRKIGPGQWLMGLGTREFITYQKVEGDAEVAADISKPILDEDQEERWSYHKG